MASRSFSRRPPFREPLRRVIIACEGTKTEPDYFDAIRSHYRLTSAQIVIAEHSGTDPRSIVEAAVKKRRELTLDKSWRSGDFAWAVFDGDEHIENNRQNWLEALDMARRKSIGVAVSNPSFELWYLLHYQDQDARITRQNLLVRLKRHVPLYEKSLCVFPDPLHPLTQTAIERAKRLTMLRVDLEEHSNPCTGVHLLVSDLLQMADEINR